MSFVATPPVPLVVFDRVAKRHGAATVLRSLSFSAARSEFVVIAGPAGSGKSTVLRLAAALERPSEGSISVAGSALAGLRGKALLHLRRSMGIVTQPPLLLDDRSVLQNVALPAAAAGMAWGEARERAATALVRSGVATPEHALRPSQLSGGAQQRVALARALVNRPALLLLDEPAAQLDVAAGAELMRLLDQFVGSGVTVLMACAHPDAVLLPPRARTIRLDVEDNR